MMRRRDVIAGLGSAGAAVAAGWYVLGGGSSDAKHVAPATIDTVDAPGSTAGTMTVPASGTVTLIDMFATWCAPCELQMRELSAAHETVGDRVQFVSVSTETLGETVTREELADWWREHDGNWLMGLDTGGALVETLQVNGLPSLYLVDEQRRQIWSHRGVANADDVVETITSLTEQ